MKLLQYRNYFIITKECSFYIPQEAPPAKVLADDCSAVAAIRGGRKQAYLQKLTGLNTNGSFFCINFLQIYFWGIYSL
jgi:hypothetical protein